MRLELACVLLLLGTPALAAPAPSEVLASVRVDQRLGSNVPLDLAFRDETGRSIRLGDCMADKPSVLSLVYYECPNLCTEVLNGMVKGFEDLPFRVGREFNVVSVSINPQETPTLAAKKQRTYLRRYGAIPAGGWHFLTGDEAAIRKLADAVGFHYAYDPSLRQYAHPSAIVLLTPRGRIARYLFGIDYAPQDLRLGLMEASENRIGSPVDRLLMRCYAFDPRAGRYTLALLTLLRGMGLLTLVGLGLFIRRLLRAERRPKEAA